MNLPLRVRLTLISTLMMAVVLVAVGLFISVRFNAETIQAVDAGLRSRTEQLMVSSSQGADLGSPGSMVDVDEAFAQVLAADGSIIESSPGITKTALLASDKVAGLAQPLFYEQTLRISGEDVSARFLAAPTEDGQVVVVGASLDDEHDAAHRLVWLSVAGGAVALAVAALVGWIVAGAALRPVERMRVQAAAVTSTEPGRRLPTPNTGDELERLATTLNDMLARLESALLREQRLVGDASHELRTPLANLKAEIDLALRRPRDESSLLRALHSAGEETDRLIRLSEDLLVLSRADHGVLGIRLEHRRLATLIEEVTTSFAARAAGLGVDLKSQIPADAMIDVDPDRFRQVMENLVDNALRHSATGESVELIAHIQGDTCGITVSDSGPGFDETFLDQAFEPFSRADQGRARAEGGGGLGLAIVKAIVEAHGGSVSAANRSEGGAVVSVVLPLN